VKPCKASACPARGVSWGKQGYCERGVYVRVYALDWDDCG